MLAVEEKEVKVEDINDEPTPFTNQLTSYGADYIVEILVKRIRRGDFYIPTFQRNYVWDIVQASRFIESLLLGLPVPGIFLAKEFDSNKHLVIDGQQRLKSLQYFYKGIFADTANEFILTGLQTPFNGYSYKTLKVEDQRRLDDAIIHATIIQQNTPDAGQNSVYSMFERLNTGGVALQPQEIRGALFHGPFNDLLKELNQNSFWRYLYGSPNLHPRSKDIELILRFFAFYFRETEYHGSLKEFLNNYMGANKDLQLESGELLSQIFIDTLSVIKAYIGDRAFRPHRAINAATVESVMVGVARRLVHGAITDGKALAKQHQDLLANPRYISAIQSNTADKESVSRRLQLATKAFSKVE